MFTYDDLVPGTKVPRLRVWSRSESAIVIASATVGLLGISALATQTAYSFYAAPRAATAVVAARAGLPLAPAIEPPGLSTAPFVALAAIAPPFASPPAPPGIAATGGAAAATPPPVAVAASAFTIPVTARAPLARVTTPATFATAEFDNAAAPAAPAPAGAPAQPPPTADGTAPPTAVAAAAEFGAAIVLSVAPIVGTFSAAASLTVGLASPAVAPQRLALLPAPAPLFPQDTELAMAIPPAANAPAAPPQPAFAPAPPQPVVPMGTVVAEIDPPLIALILRDTIDPPPPPAPAPRNPPAATTRTTIALEAAVTVGTTGAGAAVAVGLGTETEASRSSRSSRSEPDPSGSEPAVAIEIEGVLGIEVELPGVGILSSGPESPGGSGGGLLGSAVDIPLLPIL